MKLAALLRALGACEESRCWARGREVDKVSWSREVGARGLDGQSRTPVAREAPFEDGERDLFDVQADRAEHESTIDPDHQAEPDEPFTALAREPWNAARPSLPNRHGPSISTSSGLQFHPWDPRPEDVRIEDIARALSQICRFGGHTRWHYSVAQHSVLVSRHVPDEIALEGLLHDAAEAYCGDVVQPIKGWVPELEGLERGIRRAIGYRYGLLHAADDLDLPPVRHADRRALATEMRDLMLHVPAAVLAALPSPFEERIERSIPRVAEECFLRRFAELASPRGRLARGGA